MDPASAFGRGDPLDAVAAGLVEESGYRAIEFDGGGAWFEARAVWSTVRVEHSDVGREQVGDEELGVRAAFAGADLDGHGHCAESFGHGRWNGTWSVPRRQLSRRSEGWIMALMMP